jgi:ketosteroid isomerase-like protein
MKPFALFGFSLLNCFHSMAQSSWKEDSAAVVSVLSSQENAWNKADLEKFMEGYWKSDSLTFSGSAGVIFGWQNTLDRYRHSYNSQENMGKLTFQLVHTMPLGTDHIVVLGAYHLARENNNDAKGYFTLIFRKFPFGWKIVSDHTS